MSEAQYFAEIDDNNNVVYVHVVTQEFLDANPDRYTGIYVETFVNAPGKTYAGIGYVYNYETQNFYEPTHNPVE
jgi:hypothetical protein